jgi:GDP-4-dehydro-6-deoxy-D-mannose reductase
MAARAWITGAAGFVGSHLAAFLGEQGLAVHGTDVPGVPAPARWPGAWHPGDVTDADTVSEIVRRVDPTHVFHLAALIRSDSLRDLLAVNVVGTQRLLEALAGANKSIRVLVAGSAAEYGYAGPDELPIRESASLRPVNLYGVSKAAQSLLAAQYARRGPLHIVRVRTFNLIGPGEPDTMVCSAFARQVAEIERDPGRNPLRTGNVASSRDFVDIRDAVRAYWLALDRGQSGEVYNVCSGTGVTIESILQQLLGMTGAAVTVREDAGRLTPWDVPVHYGDPAKLQAATQWSPERPLAASLADLLADWRRRIVRADRP